MDVLDLERTPQLGGAADTLWDDDAETLSMPGSPAPLLPPLENEMAPTGAPRVPPVPASFRDGDGLGEHAAITDGRQSSSLSVGSGVPHAFELRNGLYEASQETLSIRTDSPPAAQPDMVEEPTSQNESDKSPMTDSASDTGKTKLARTDWSSLIHGPQDDFKYLKAPACTKCKYPVHDVFRAKYTGKQKEEETLICRHCVKVMNMCYKRLDWPVEGFESLGQEELDHFYQTAIEKAETGNVTWNSVRQALVNSLSRHEIHQRTVSVAEKELPLSVWQQDGFDIELIKEHGRKGPHPVFGEVWAVPLKVISTDQVMLICVCLITHLMSAYIGCSSVQPTAARKIVSVCPPL